MEDNNSLKTDIYISAVKHFSTQEPFHEILVQKQDTLYRYDLWKKSKSFVETNYEEIKAQNTLKFSDNREMTKVENLTSYDNFYINKDTTHFLTFIKTESGQNLTTKSFLKLVSDKYFTSHISKNKTPNTSLDIKETLLFSKDSITYYWDYTYQHEIIYQEKEQVKLNWFEVEDQLFAFPSNEDNPYPIMQIFKTKDNKIEIRDFINFEMQSHTYTKDESFNPNNYKNYNLCRNDFQKIYYVGEEVRYNKGLEYLVKHLRKNAPRANNEGFINIHFTINCKGEVGRLGLELLNRDYQPTSFKPELIKHITDQVTQLRSWDNYNIDPYYDSKDVKAFFLIKIDNHKIADVCP